MFFLLPEEHILDALFDSLGSFGAQSLDPFRTGRSQKDSIAATCRRRYG